MFLSLLFRFHMFLFFPFLFWSLTLFFLFARKVPLPFYLSDWSLGVFWAWPILFFFLFCFHMFLFFFSFLVPGFVFFCLPERSLCPFICQIGPWAFFGLGPSCFFSFSASTCSCFFFLFLFLSL